MKSFTAEEDAFLLANYRKRGSTATANAMGRTKSSVIGRMARLEGRSIHKPRPKKERSFYQTWSRVKCRAPYEPDSSVPDFANDDEHVAAIFAASPSGFQVLNARR